VIDGRQAPNVGFHTLKPNTPELEDRINGRYWFVNAYLVRDRVHQLSLRASPFMSLLKERELRDVRYSKLFADIPFGTYQSPIIVPASEVEQPRRLSWHRG
jgi:hypothetical protein